MSVLHRDAITGAFGYSGKYITMRLLDRGHEVLTLTGHTNRPNPFGKKVMVAPFNFDAPEKLTRSLEGVDTLYNTYWVRFPRSGMTHERTVENTKILFRAAKAAGVRRVVHVSITNPSTESPLSYFRGKAELERFLKESTLSYAILRPAVLFGGKSGEDILINNIAWLLRRFPVFAVMGDGGYGLQPIHVEDLADLAVEAGQSSRSYVADGCGPETYRYIDLVKLIKRETGSRAIIVRVHPMIVFAAAQIIGKFAGDVVLTRDEITGLMDNLLVSGEKPAGRIRLSEWLSKNAHRLGVTYASETQRHYK